MWVTGAGTGWDGHLLLLHATEAERREGLVSWALRGLSSGEKVIWTEPDPDSESGLVGLLRAQGVDTVAALADGLLEPLPLNEFYPPEGQEAVVRRALDAGWPRVRMSAESAFVMTLVPQQRRRASELAMDEMCRTLPVSAMCQYDRARLDPAELAGAVDLHLGGVRERQLCTAEPNGTLALVGQVDAENSDVLASMLRAACRRADGELSLDLTALDFLDASGARALASATAPYRTDGGSVVLEGAQPLVARVLTLLRADQLPGLTLLTGASL